MTADATPGWLLAFGLLGQALFFGRFLAQWVASERERRSVVPMSFWYLSVGGGALLLVYAVLRRDPVIVLGQCAGLVVYARNIVLRRREAATAVERAPRVSETSDRFRA